MHYVQCRQTLRGYRCVRKAAYNASSEMCPTCARRKRAGLPPLIEYPPEGGPPWSLIGWLAVAAFILALYANSL